RASLGVASNRVSGWDAFGGWWSGRCPGSTGFDGSRSAMSAAPTSIRRFSPLAAHSFAGRHSTDDRDVYYSWGSVHVLVSGDQGASMGESTALSLGWSEALAWRMRQQLLDPVGAESVAGVVRRLCAISAQPDAAAELAVRTRRAQSRSGEVARALTEGQIIKAYAF